MTIRGVTFAAMMMTAAGIAVPAGAQEALILGNEDYDRGTDVTRGAAVVDAARALGDAGADVISGRDVTADRQAQLLAAFEDTAAAGGGGRLAVLSGRFVSAGAETWFLPVDGQATSLASLPREAIPLSSVMAMLGGGSGPALLVLGSDGAGGDAGMGQFVTAGIGTVASTQDVTVISGAPRDVSSFVRDVLAVPGARIDGAGDRGLTVRGDPAAASFLPSGTPAPAPATPSPDDTAWRQARSGDTIAGYADYLDRHPRGQHATDARARLERLRGDPVSRAQAAEDALSLGRDARRGLQRDLTALGFDTNGVDGIFGAGSRRAIARWQAGVGLPQTGYLDSGQIDRLEAAAAAVAPAPAPSAGDADADYWAQTGQSGTVAGAGLYLDRYPSGRFADIARDRVSSDGTAGDGTAEESRAWAQAERVGTERSYNGYLRSYPDGAHAGDARTRLAALQRPPTVEDQLNDLLTDGINNLLKKN